MFLGMYLYFSNIVIIMFCYYYITYLYTDVKKIKELTDKQKQDRFKDKTSYEAQLKYINIHQEIDRKNFILFPFKVLILMVAILIAFNLKNEPYIIFGYRLGFFTNIFILVMFAVLMKKILKKIGIKNI